MRIPADGGLLDGEATDVPDRPARSNALAVVGIRARRYLLEPGDGPWYDVVRALTDALGDDEAYDLLRAIEIRVHTNRTR